LMEALKRRLDSARLLIVLDNCEHLVEACAELAHDLLSSCERLRILTTSREPLKVAGEATWLVPGLELPEAPDLPTEELGRYAAIRLFFDRAAAASPGFALQAVSAEAVARLCRRLDGIPLAIELAAARTRALSPEDILRRLDDRFKLLAGGDRGALERQQTLRATVDWSHDLLQNPECVLFRRLSVFAGAFALGDAEQVCAGEQLAQDAVWDPLCELVAKSMVVSEPSAGGIRYRMLETLRDYAADRLVSAGERQAVGRLHFDYFLALAERAAEQQETQGSGAGLEALLAQQDNIRAALAFASTDPADLLRLAAAAEQLWLAGNVSEGRRWLERALARAPEPTRSRVRALNAAAALSALQAAIEQARSLVNESVALASSIRDRAGEARARVWLGFLDLNMDPPQTTQSRQSLEINEALGDRLGICRSLAFLGAVMTQQPDGKQEGYEALLRAVAIAREVQDDWGEGFARIFLGWAEIERGNREVAARHLQQALEIEALGPIRGTALDCFARLALEYDPRRTIRLLAAANALRDRGGGRPPAWIRRRAASMRARAEEQLHPRDAQRAWEEGSTMKTDQTIAYAIQEACGWATRSR
ncbi:MAG: hypothetical protein JO240_10635, partial [Solirubrobacterales bacterium]|nr:hypothetical protein [Solirubrobacterales bacterium]